MSPSISRRRALQLGAAASAFGAVGLTSCSSGGSGEERSNKIVVSTFPFGVEEFTKAVIDPFTEATGIEVELSTGSNADRLSRLRLENGEDGTDVTLMSDTYAAMADQDGLFQEVTAEKVAALNDIAEFAVDKAYTGPAYSYQLNGALYRKDKLDAAEATAWDLYANSQYSGKIALPDIAVTAGLLTVAGVGSAYGENPYDIDTAFATMSEWAPNVLQFYSSTTEFTNLLTQGEVYGGVAINAFATDLVAAGEPIAWKPVDEGRFMATNRAMIPVGAPNLDGAYQFVDFLLSKKAQQSSAELVGDLPVNLSVDVPKKLTDVVGDLADDPTAAGYQTLDPAEVAPNRPEWVEQFAREVVGA